MLGPETDLERALRLAADDPAARPEFYHTLLASEVFVIGPADADQPARGELKRGNSVSIESWSREDGSTVIPFFSSQDALERALGAVGAPAASYLRLPARALFEITAGNALVFNPTHTYGKEFFPQEIASMLEGGVNQAPQRRVTEKDTEVMLGQPKVTPTALLDALRRFLATRPAVRAAYLAMMHDPSVDSGPTLIVGIDADGEPDSLFREIGSVATDTLPPGDLVDLVQVRAGEAGVSDYFLRSVTPFYTRSLGGSLKSAFGFGGRRR